MYQLIIDTCVWINLCEKYPDLLEQFAHLVNQNIARLILPSIIIDEWERHKPDILKNRSQSIGSMIKQARSLSSRLDIEDAKVYKEILDRFREQEDKGSKVASESLKRVDALVKHPSTTILEITDTSRLQAVNYALNKKAPFQAKNSMADALIIFRTIEYIAAAKLENCIFVSSNTDDFASKNKQDIHDDLRESFDRYGIKYFSRIELAINHIEAGLVDFERVQEIAVQVELDAAEKAAQEAEKAGLRFKEYLESKITSEIANNAIRVKTESFFKEQFEFFMAGEIGALSTSIRISQGMVPILRRQGVFDEASQIVGFEQLASTVGFDWSLVMSNIDASKAIIDDLFTIPSPKNGGG